MMMGIYFAQNDDVTYVDIRIRQFFCAGRELSRP